MTKVVKMSAIVLDKDEMAKLDIPKAQEEMQKDITDYEAHCATMDDKQLKEEEDKLMKIFQKNDEYIKNVAYELPAEFKQDDETVAGDDVDKMIVDFLESMEVDWKFTLGIYQAILFWKDRKGKKVPYATFDSTLRLLGTLKFKGEKQLHDILTINNYLASDHNGYQHDLLWIQYLSTKHNVIMQAMDKLHHHPENQKNDAE